MAAELNIDSKPQSGFSDYHLAQPKMFQAFASSVADKALDWSIKHPGPAAKVAKVLAKANAWYNGGDQQAAASAVDHWVEDLEKGVDLLDNSQYSHYKALHHNNAMHAMHGNPPSKIKKLAQKAKNSKAKAPKRQQQRQRQQQPMRNIQSTTSVGLPYVASTTPVIATQVGVTITAHGQDHIRVRGRQLLCSIATPNMVTIGTVFLTANLDGHAFANTRLESYFSTYERWSPHYLSVSIVSSVPSSTPGQYAIYLEPDPQDLPQPLAVLDWQAVNNEERARTFSVFGAVGRATLARRGRFEPLWCESTMATTGDVPRLTSPGGVVALCGPGIGPNLTLGSAFIDFDITFHYPVQRPQTVTYNSVYALAQGVAPTSCPSVPAGDFIVGLMSAHKDVVGAYTPAELACHAQYGYRDFMKPDIEYDGFHISPGYYLMSIRGLLSGPLFAPSATFAARHGTGSARVDPCGFGAMLTSTGGTVWTNSIASEESYAFVPGTIGIGPTTRRTNLTMAPLGKYGDGEIKDWPHLEEGYPFDATALIGVTRYTASMPNRFGAGADVSLAVDLVGNNATATPVRIIALSVMFIKLPGSGLSDSFLCPYGTTSSNQQPNDNSSSSTKDEVLSGGDSSAAKADLTRNNSIAGEDGVFIPRMTRR